MDEEKLDQEFAEEPIQDEAADVQEEFEIEDSYEEMEEELQEDDLEDQAEKGSFWKDLSHQAVSKIFFLFAGIGFFFPFFTVACQGQATGLVTKGFDMFKNSTIPMQQGLEIPVPIQPIIIAAFAAIVIGLILSVFLKGLARNVAGAVCSILSTVLLAVFAITLPQAIIDVVKNYAISLGIQDVSQLGDLSIITPIFEPGMYYVISLMVINFIYYIVQIALDSKRRANEVLEYEEGIVDQDWDEQQMPVEEISETDIEAEIEPEVTEVTDADAEEEKKEE